MFREAFLDEVRMAIKSLPVRSDVHRHEVLTKIFVPQEVVAVSAQARCTNICLASSGGEAHHGRHPIWMRDCDLEVVFWHDVRRDGFQAISQVEGTELMPEQSLRTMFL